MFEDTRDAEARARGRRLDKDRLIYYALEALENEAYGAVRACPIWTADEFLARYTGIPQGDIKALIAEVRAGLSPLVP